MQTSADAIIAGALDWEDRRSVLPWLLLSLVLHAVLVVVLQGRFELPRYEAPVFTPPLEISLRRERFEPAPAVVESVPEPIVREEQSPAETPRSEVAPMIPKVTTAPAGRRAVPLDLTLPEFDELDKLEEEVETDNGATVMNPKLLTRLQQAPRRSGYSARTERAASGEFQSSGWIEFVRNGDVCFQVARANQLDSFGYDVWYRVPCPISDE